MTKEQRYDPKEQQEKYSRLRQEQSDELKRLKSQVKEGKSQKENEEAVRHYKAQNTDLKRALVI